LVDPRLLPAGPQVPGANGIKFFSGSAYISVTDSNKLLRVAVNADGSAGAVDVLARDIRADDMAFDAKGNLYIATHPANSVLRLAQDGTRTTIAGPSEGAVGATSCAFGRAPEDLGALYVTTTGGAWSPYQGVVQPAKLVRFEVGATGQSLLS
jgi:sugar lactone lactonase YvrE